MISPSTLIISMTSWPPRINAVASAYRAVTCQIEPDMDVHCVLVLCTEECPGRESSLPKDVLDFGVEILWTATNTKSHKKLMPTLRRYPDNPILVIDDDTCQVEGWLRTFLTDHAKHIMLCIPKGERSNLGYTTRRLEASGKVEIYEVPVDFGRINPMVYTMLRHSSSSTLIVSDSRIYDSTLIERMQMEYFHNPQHVYACDVDTHAGRNLARLTGGILIPPSTIATQFNLPDEHDDDTQVNALQIKYCVI